MRICFITGPEGSGTTALVRAFANHPAVVKGDAERYGHPALHGAAGAQLIPAALMATRRPGCLDVGAPAEARRRIEESAAALFAAQPETRAIFFKYSTPASRPALWPVFLPLFEIPAFRVIVIWRNPLDAVYSGFRRFYGHHPRRALGLLAAARTYAHGVRHIRGQLRRSPGDRWVSLRYETLVARPEPAVRELCAFAELDYLPAHQLLPGRGFSDENGKWKRALRERLVGGSA